MDSIRIYCYGIVELEQMYRSKEINYRCTEINHLFKTDV